MPKLAENVLIGGVVRLAGEDVSDADAKGIRAEAFVSEDGSDADEKASDQATDEDASDADEKAEQPRSRGKRASSK